MTDKSQGQGWAVKHEHVFLRFVLLYTHLSAVCLWTFSLTAMLGHHYILIRRPAVWVKKCYTPKVSGNITPKSENFNIKFYAPILRKITQFYWVISTLTKLYRINRDYLVNFYISLEYLKNCDISATVWQISTKFGRLMLNVSLKYTAVTNFSFKNPRWQRQFSIKKSWYLMMM